MKHMTYRTSGTCSRQIELTLDDNDIIREVKFVGGCPGNTSGISQLVVGMPARDVIERLRGVRCGQKSTSCPDQLSRALEECLRGAEAAAH